MTEISIEYQDIRQAVSRQLAIIGKHHKAQNGGTLFTTAALSEIEQDVMPDIIVAAAQAAIGELSPIVTAYDKNDERLTFGVDDTRSGAALPKAVKAGMTAYVTAYVTAGVLSMSLPDAAQKYTADAQQQLAALTRTAFSKEAPSVTDMTLNVSGKVTMDSDETKDGYSKTD